MAVPSSSMIKWYIKHNTYLNLDSSNGTTVSWGCIAGFIRHGIWEWVGHGQSGAEAAHQNSYECLDKLKYRFAVTNRLIFDAIIEGYLK